MVTTFAAISWDVYRGAQSADELNEVPLMAMMFWLMVWHAQRRLDADHERDLVSDENARLLATQRRFLQDASHQLRTPITIALGHAELLARELTDGTEQRDIQVVVGELTRLRRLGERLLVIAASEDPDFLRPEPVALDGFTMDVIRRWRRPADRQWQVGRLDEVTVAADRERLGLAVDALLENAVRHTCSGDMIQLSVLVTGPGLPVRMIVADTGEGIAPSQLEHIFDRFRTGTPAGGTAGGGAGWFRGLSRGRKLALTCSASVLAVVVALLAIGATSGGAPKPAPQPRAQAFTLSRLGHPGQHISLAQYAGHPLILNFFASWCEPCQRETPLIARFYRSHRHSVIIIGIDVNDTSSAGLAFARKMGVAYPVASDPAPMTM